MIITDDDEAFFCGAVSGVRGAYGTKLVGPGSVLEQKFQAMV